MRIYAYSKALYSTWMYVEPLRLLLDAGEGLNTFLEGRLLAFRDLLVSHAHTDHFTGIQNILITRLREMEVTKTDLPIMTITYPGDSPTLQRYFEYLQDVVDRFDDLAELRPVKPGDTLPLYGARGLHVTALKANHHVHGQTALAYRVEQERWTLKPEMEGIPQKEINKRIALEGREAVTTKVFKPVLYYSGDGRVSMKHHDENIPLMLHECTFIEPNRKVTHASLPDIIQLFRKAKPEQLLLFHLSTRYEFKEFLRTLDRMVPNPEERAKIFAVRPGSFFSRDIPVPGF